MEIPLSSGSCGASYNLFRDFGFHIFNRDLLSSFVQNNFREKFYIFCYNYFVHVGFMRHRGITLRAWWNVCNIAMAGSFLLSTFFEFFTLEGLREGNFHQVSIVEKTRRDQPPLLSFTTSVHGVMGGMQTIFFLINMPMMIRYFFEIFPWPIGHVCAIIACVRSCLVIQFYFSTFLFPTHKNLLIVGL